MRQVVCVCHLPTHMTNRWMRKEQIDVLIMYVYQFGQITPRYPIIPTNTPGISSISHHATRWMRQEREGRGKERGREGEEERGRDSGRKIKDNK